MPVDLRTAESGDAAQVAEVLISSRQAFVPFAPSSHSPADMRSWVTHKLLPTGRVTLAEVEGRLAGVMATSHDGVASWIDQLYIRPGYLSRGIGARLLASALTALPPPIRLYTFQANTGARRFFERHGYIAIEFTDGRANEEKCPDVLYEYRPECQAVRMESSTSFANGTDR
ncbi:MAG TPA: GNAT family N-acetyltransferase [Steroidobacteraceae bacterium]|jgi:GNAT superfamily N-acetyltransferase|nr:GNAT family N-acetyltransferase [Steroidobacteraceae bacterium]